MAKSKDDAEFEFMATDATASELRSVQMLRRCVKLDGHGAEFPNICHTRDKAHSTKRVLVRPFKADAVLESSVQGFILA